MSVRATETDPVELHEDILECVCDAILKLDEARGIAAAEWGDDDARVKTIEGVWTEAYSLRQWALDCIAELRIGNLGRAYNLRDTRKADHGELMCLKSVWTEDEYRQIEKDRL